MYIHIFTHIHTRLHTFKRTQFTHIQRSTVSDGRCPVQELIRYRSLEYHMGSPQWQVGQVKQHTAAHCNPRQPTATHCRILQRTAAHCSTLQSTANYCNIHTTCVFLNGKWGRYSTHCNTLQHTAAHCNSLQHTAMHCSTLQCNATHCSLMQHTHHLGSVQWQVEQVQ